MGTTEPIRDKQDVQRLIEYYLDKGELRNYVLVTMGVYTALRISDLLNLKWEDVYDFEKKQTYKNIYLIEKKTNKPKIVALNKAVRSALNRCAKVCAARGSAIISNPQTGKAIRREHAYRIIRTAAESIGLGCRVSCHSLRKTFGYHAWKNRVSPTVIMDIYNHNSLGITRRYLGVTQDDKNAVYTALSFL